MYEASCPDVMRYTLIPLLATSLGISPLSLGAQEPAPRADSAAVALRADALAVRDDDGNVILEELIAARMRPPRRQILRTFLGAMAGLAVFVAATQPSNDCSIYEPCTAREKFQMNVGPFVGMFVGGVLGRAMADPGVNRWQAVEQIREERRAAKTDTSRTTP